MDTLYHLRPRPLARHKEIPVDSPARVMIQYIMGNNTTYSHTAERDYEALIVYALGIAGWRGGLLIGGVSVCALLGCIALIQAFQVKRGLEAMRIGASLHDENIRLSLEATAAEAENQRLNSFEGGNDVLAHLWERAENAERENQRLREALAGAKTTIRRAQMRYGHPQARHLVRCDCVSCEGIRSIREALAEGRQT